MSLSSDPTIQSYLLPSSSPDLIPIPEPRPHTPSTETKLLKRRSAVRASSPTPSARLSPPRIETIPLTPETKMQTGRKTGMGTRPLDFRRKSESHLPDHYSPTVGLGDDNKDGSLERDRDTIRFRAHRSYSYCPTNRPILLGNNFDSESDTDTLQNTMPFPYPNPDPNPYLTLAPLITPPSTPPQPASPSFDSLNDKVDQHYHENLLVPLLPTPQTNLNTNLPLILPVIPPTPSSPISHAQIKAVADKRAAMAHQLLTQRRLMRQGQISRNSSVKVLNDAEVIAREKEAGEKMVQLLAERERNKGFKEWERRRRSGIVRGELRV